MTDDPQHSPIMQMLQHSRAALAAEVREAFAAGRRPDEFLLFCIDRTVEPWTSLAAALFEALGGTDNDPSLPIAYGVLSREAARAAFADVHATVEAYLTAWPIQPGEILVFAARGDSAGIHSYVYDEKPHTLN